MRAVEAHFGPAFLSALMLTCSFKGAERAVADAIATLPPDATANDLLIATAKCAVEQGESADQVHTRDRLPPELGRLLLLSPMSRKCFVLRMLLRFTAELSSRILGLRSSELEKELWQALQDLTFGPDNHICPECRAAADTARADRSGRSAVPSGEVVI